MSKNELLELLNDPEVKTAISKIIVDAMKRDASIATSIARFSLANARISDSRPNDVLNSSRCPRP